MPSSISPAVDEAARLPDIQFPEFTAKLITDTFDALISANLRQTASYIELVGAISKTLTEYINDTKDGVSGAEILEFLATVLPPTTANASGIPTGALTAVAAGATLTTLGGTTLTNALTVPGMPPPTVPTGALTTADVSTIGGEVAQRLAGNKYALLKEMVTAGILRLIVSHGVIETKLTFSTYASSFYQRNSSAYNSSNFNLNASASTGKALSKWFNASASTKYTSVSVRTTNETQRDVAGSSVNIFGHVEVHFRTDFQPLSPPSQPA